MAHGLWAMNKSSHPEKPEKSIQKQPEKEFAEEENCAICRDLLRTSETLTTPCGHTFHAQCLLEWTNRQAFHATCPYCRQLIGDKKREVENEPLLPFLVRNYPIRTTLICLLYYIASVYLATYFQH